MVRKERPENLCLMSFFFQRDYLQHVAQDVIKTVTLLFLSFGNVFFYEVSRQQWQLHSVFSCIMKTVLLSRLYVFIISHLPPRQSEIPGSLTTIAERLCGP